MNTPILNRCLAATVLAVAISAPAAAQAPAPPGEAAAVPVVLLRRSARTPPSGGDDVLVPANLATDAIARRVAHLMSDPSGYSQFVLRLDRAVKAFLLNDPALPASRRASIDQPAFLFLSDRQGGFPAESFWLEQPDGSLRQMRDVAFVDTVVGEKDLDTGDIGGLEAIYAHELGHLMMAALAGPAPRKASSAVHFITVRTDAWYAFTEGFGEHFQPMALDHYGDRIPSDRRAAPPPPWVQRWHARFAHEQEAGCGVCPANLRFLWWHGTGEQRWRDVPVRQNAFIHQVPLPEGFAGDRRPPFEAQMYRDVAPPRGSGPLKNGVQMLESEGVIATLFHRIASDPRLRDTYRPADFYRPFLAPDRAARLDASGPQAAVTPAENVYLKIFAVMHRAFRWGTWPALELVKGYAAAFPDEAAAVYDDYLEVTRGVTVEHGAAARHAEQGYLAGVRHRVVAGSAALDAALPPPLWMAAPGIRLGMGLFRYVPVPIPFTFDLNAADVADLREGAGVSPTVAEAIVRAREARGGFTSVDELRAVPGVTPEQASEFAAMHARMQERLARSEPRRADSGSLKNYLVAVLKGCYYGAALWQFGRALFLAGLGFVVVSLAAARLRRVPDPVAVAGTPGRARWIRRSVRAVSRGMGAAVVPLLASVGLYAAGVRPSPGAMAVIGLALGLAWHGIVRVRQREAVMTRAEAAQAVVAAVTMSVIIGALY